MEADRGGAGKLSFESKIRFVYRNEYRATRFLVPAL